MARYCVRRKVEEKDLPQCSAAGDSPLPIDWEISKPLVLPTQEGEPWKLASSREGQLSEAGQPLEQETGQAADKPSDGETVTADLPKEPSGEVSLDRGDPHPRQEDPAPMSVDSVDPAAIPTPPDSDESCTELYERACGHPAQTAVERGRDKRSRSPDFFPEKRPKLDVLRAASANNKETIKANCVFPLASLTGSPSLEGMEAALTAWIAQICDRPSGQELSVDEERRFAAEVEAAKNRELDAWGKVQVFSPVLSGKVTKDVVDTRWVLTWKDLEGKGL